MKIKTRSLCLLAMFSRKSGAHGKSNKAKRRLEKVRQIKEALDRNALDRNIDS